MGKAYINNHYRLRIRYHVPEGETNIYRIVGFEVLPMRCV